MGTSISHPSPKSTNWKPVSVCYTEPTIPEWRVLNEIWRASEKESNPISDMLKSRVAFECYNAVRSSKSFVEALNKFNEVVHESKGNSMIAEFAKRVIPLSFQSKQPGKEWSKNFLSEVTNYIASRDLSGFVGKGYRNKSVRDMLEFKQRISDMAKEIVSRQYSGQIESMSDWRKFIDTSVEKLRTEK